MQQAFGHDFGCKILSYAHRITTKNLNQPIFSLATTNTQWNSKRNSFNWPIWIRMLLCITYQNGWLGISRTSSIRTNLNQHEIIHKILVESTNIYIYIFILLTVVDLREALIKQTLITSTTNTAILYWPCLRIKIYLRISYLHSIC